MTQRFFHRRRLVAASVAMLALPFAAQTAAQTATYPTKAVRVVVPFGAGGVGDGAIALDGETANRVLDLRESVQSDAAKLAYLREYATSCYRAGVEGAWGLDTAR